MPNRPYIICHMIASIDGKILSRRWKHLALPKEVTSLYESTASEFNVSTWLVGTKTLKEFFPGSQDFAIVESDISPGDFIAGKAVSYAIGCDASGSIMFDSDEIGGDKLIIITTEKASKSYLAHLRSRGISYLLCGKNEINFSQALEKLGDVFELSKILLEGGGLINGAMLQAGLVDEISQLFLPVVDGGGADVSGIFDLRDASTDRAMCALSLIEQKTLAQGTIWLRYKVLHKSV